MKISTILALIPLTVISSIAQGSADSVGDDLFSDEELPLVLSVTKLRQSQAETPASVTIIDRKKIARSGARSIEEVLRLVPGVTLGYTRGNSPEVSIHGLNGEFSRRIQVLVDGRSLFKPGLARVLWSNLPLSLDDIERIEVVRGPNTATYGANAFLGVINIITRHPSDIVNNKVSISNGANGILDGNVRLVNNNEHLSYKFSYGHSEDDGFAGQFNNNRRFDEHQNDYLAFDVASHADMGNQWRLQLGISKSKQQVDLLDIYEAMPYHLAETEDRFIQLNWDHNISDKHELKINAYYNDNNIDEQWQTCPLAFFMTDELGALYDLDANYTEQFIEALQNSSNIPTPPSLEVAAAAQLSLSRLANLGLETNCGYANQNFNETKWELEIQDTIRLNDKLRLVSGLSFRHDQIEGESFFDSKVDNDVFRLFTNMEWKINPNWLMNLGAMYEKGDLVDADFSPRVAINYLPSAQSGFRFIVAKGTRAPNFYEQTAHRRYTVRQLDFPINGNNDFATFYVTPRSSGQLISETNLSKEIGWFYRPSATLEFDVKIFYDDLENVIDGLFGLQNFVPGNDLDLTNKGLDFQMNYSINSSNHLWFSYSHLDVDNKRGRSTRHMGAGNNSSILYTHDFSNSSRLSLGYYLNDIERRNNFERIDLSYKNSFQIGKQDLSLEFVVQHNLNDEPFFSRENIYHSSTKAFVRASIDF